MLTANVGAANHIRRMVNLAQSRTSLKPGPHDWRESLPLPHNNQVLPHRPEALDIPFRGEPEVVPKIIIWFVALDNADHLEEL